jgi:hypothetical protein
MFAADASRFVFLTLQWRMRHAHADFYHSQALLGRVF